MLTPDQKVLADAAALEAFDAARALSNLPDERLFEAEVHAARAVNLMVGRGFDPATEAPAFASEAVRAWVTERLGGPDGWDRAYRAYETEIARLARQDVRI